MAIVFRDTHLGGKFVMKNSYALFTRLISSEAEEDVHGWGSALFIESGLPLHNDVLRYIFVQCMIQYVVGLYRS